MVGLHANATANKLPMSSHTLPAGFSSLQKMTKRFLNVQYGEITAGINVTEMEHLSEVKSAIKAEFGDAIPVAPALIQLYTNSNKVKEITDFDEITPQYYQKMSKGGSCVFICKLL